MEASQTCSQIQSSYYSSYFLPVCRNITAPGFFYKALCRITGAGERPPLASLAYTRLSFLIPHMRYQLVAIVKVICNNFFFDKQKAKQFENHRESFAKLLEYRENIIKNTKSEEGKTDQPTIESLNRFIKAIDQPLIDAFEWHLELPQKRHLAILRNLFLLKDKTFINSLVECFNKNEESKVENKFDKQQIAFLLNYELLIKILKYLALIGVVEARNILDKPEIERQILKEAVEIQTNLKSAFISGDILIEDVPRKIDLLGLHLPTLLQAMYFTQGPIFHVSILQQGESEIYQNMMGMAGYTHQPASAITLLPVTALRFKEQKIAQKIADLSNLELKQKKIDIHTFKEQCKALFDLHESPETNVLRKVCFYDRESCSSFVAKVVVNALFEVDSSIENPFQGYDLNYITPNSLQLCLTSSKLAELVGRTISLDP